MAYLLQQLLEASAARFPSAAAVAFGGETLTYAELDRQSSQLAAVLRSRGVLPGDRVALHVPKSLPAIVAIFGALKAGAVYVPLDPAAPGARLGYILRDCGVRCVITGPRDTRRGRTEPILGDGQPLATLIVAGGGADEAPDGLPAQEVIGWPAVLSAAPLDAPAAGTESDLAYILYTSGSTGRPKGVMISHRNALTFVEWSFERFGVRPDDRLSNHAPFHFDLSVFDIFVAVRAGASVHPVPEGLSTFPVRLAAWLEEQRITVWYSVPSVLMLLALHGKLSGRALDALRLVLFAGEVFPLKHLQTLAAALPGPRYFNLYGPTETNVCTYYEVEPAALMERTAPLPIGRLCENMGGFAVDEAGQPVVRPGEVGELLIRGPGVALGYWGRPDLTAAGFVPNPLSFPYRDTVYRTGDLVTLDEQGNYLYLGRKDHQIKSRGYRIELGEIESVLYEHPLVREAAVVAVPDELVGARIRAVVAPAEGAALTAAEIQAHCAGRLPRYMAPESVEIREQLPRTLNGKVDRAQLALGREAASTKGERR